MVDHDDAVAVAQSSTVTQGETYPAAANDDVPTNNVEALRRINADQAQHIDKLQHQLNESQVKCGEQVYWLRLELDSARREKEAAEDRMGELYRGVQELLNNQNGRALDESTQTEDICTEPDYVRALQERLAAYEGSVEILNRQITMMKTSSEVVVTSMKQEVTDLVEEKSHMELDLLNQISNLDNEKRALEHQLLAKEVEEEQPDANNLPPISSATSICVLSTSEAMATAVDDEGEIRPVDKVASTLALDSMPESGKVHEESFCSTATSQGSSFTHDATVSTPLLVSDHSNEEQLKQEQMEQDQSELVESLMKEVSTWKEEAELLKATNNKLQKQVEEITKDLIFTRSSANVALALDKIETDRAETVAHLDRIAVLWDRADSTIQTMEGLLAEFQNGAASSECHPSNASDKERLLSTLEMATLVHGQTKMSLMLIELSFRNHLTSIKNDNLQELQSIRVSDKVEQACKDTLSAIATAETNCTVAVERVEQQIHADNQSTNGALRMQLDKLKQAQDKQKLLESELKAIREKPNQFEEVGGTELASQKDANAPSSAGFVVSRSMLFKLQKEILSVVAVVQEKNEAIQLLMATIDKYKLREDVLKKELKRAVLKTQKKHRTVQDSKAVGAKKPLDLQKVASVRNGSGSNKDSKASFETTGDNQQTRLPVFPITPRPDRIFPIVKSSSPASLAPKRKKAPSESDPCWSTL